MKTAFDPGSNRSNIHCTSEVKSELKNIPSVCHLSFCVGTATTLPPSWHLCSHWRRQQPQRGRRQAQEWPETESLMDGWHGGMAHKIQGMKGLLQVKFTYSCVGICITSTWNSIVVMTFPFGGVNCDMRFWFVVRKDLALTGSKTIHNRKAIVVLRSRLDPVGHLLETWASIWHARCRVPIYSFTLLWLNPVYFLYQTGCQCAGNLISNWTILN